MSDLDLLDTDIENDLRASVRELLVDHCDPTAVTAIYDGDDALVGAYRGTLGTGLTDSQQLHSCSP
jgi:hypothetical protein